MTKIKRTECMKRYFNKLKKAFLLPEYGIKINPIISGGCIRDTLLEKPVKDIDIFLPKNEVDTFLAYFGKSARDCKCTFYWEDTNMKEQYRHSNILATYEIDIYPPTASETFFVNIIVLTDNMTKDEICDRHAFGICQCALDKDGFYFSDAFIKDYINKTMTLMRTEWGYDQTMKYFIRLYNKLKMPMRCQEIGEAF